MTIKNCLNALIQKCVFLYRSHLNDGEHDFSNVLEQFSIKYEIYTNIGLSKKDKVSVRCSSTKFSEERKNKLKGLRGNKKGVIDKNNKQKKPSYVFGGF